jgi:hypothetical protein
MMRKINEVCHSRGVPRHQCDVQQFQLPCQPFGQVNIPVLCRYCLHTIAGSAVSLMVWKTKTYLVSAAEIQVASLFIISVRVGSKRSSRLPGTSQVFKNCLKPILIVGLYPHRHRAWRQPTLHMLLYWRHLPVESNCWSTLCWDLENEGAIFTMRGAGLLTLPWPAT